MNTLCIAIPTFNRGKKLEKSLKKLSKEILKVDYKNNISVLVSDNGSSDNTYKVINEYKKIFEKNKISFVKHGFDKNQGFDKNLFNCYKHADSKYVWFLSDDDIISDDAISVILEDINANEPNVIYYNFEQPPYTKKNKYISKTCFHKKIDNYNIDVIAKMAYWPKLSALVLKKIKIPKPFIEKEIKFMHIALAMYIVLKIGRIMHSQKFIAKVDDDYLDNVDFPPYVTNYMDETISTLMALTKKNNLLNAYYNKYPLMKIDPVISSLKYMTNLYRSGLFIKKDLENELNQIIYTGALSKGIKILISPLYLKYYYAYLHKYFPLSIISSLRRFKRNRYK